jgi:nitroimidazol reductase NimA-like FMN-containing flavoprotein (pyridoxamine 5'-phosphate oxidase superfamily)
MKPNQPAADPRVEMRRKDRQVNDEAWIVALLKRAPVGVLATVQEDQPYLNPNLFVYDETRHAIYMHSARIGRTHDNLEQGEQETKVCFSASEMGRLLPASEALEMSVEFNSVIVFGRARIVEDAEEARRMLQMLLDKYFSHLKSGQDYRPIQPEELKRTAVYCIQIETWSGKRKQVDADFPGAFNYQFG